MYSYLGSQECIKPKDNEVLDHQNRMKTLMRYADRLNGMAPKPTDSSNLKLVFKSFHTSHAMNYKLMGNKFTAATKLEDIIDFMKLQKHNQDMKASQFIKREPERTTKITTDLPRKEKHGSGRSF